ncbi:MAG: hypothetical protein KJ826_03130 [Proteobacteria bacterium]|nr:hypothetical protein [Pseudomonadota bacterium]MBU4036172.1 hypothetical protein [Pseudomonadota bacterium]
MRKRILGLVLGLLLGFLLIVSNGFAADGDLIVNGKVGVGTTTPTEKLDVNGTVKATGFVGPGIIRQIKSVSPTTNISTTSTTLVDMDGMSITLTTGNSTLLIFWNATFYNTTQEWTSVAMILDGTRVGGFTGAHDLVDSTAGHCVVSPVAAGTHVVKLRWKVNSGTSEINSGSYPDYYGRTLTVIEVGQ